MRGKVGNKAFLPVWEVREEQLSGRAWSRAGRRQRGTRLTRDLYQLSTVTTYKATGCLLFLARHVRYWICNLGVIEVMAIIYWDCMQCG